MVGLDLAGEVASNWRTVLDFLRRLVESDKIYSFKVGVIGGEIVYFQILHDLEAQCIIGKKAISTFHLLALFNSSDIRRQYIKIE